MRIGFIGTGNIGTPMAASILKAGYELVVHDIHRDKTTPLVGQGAEWADSPAEVAAQCDIICTCLPGPTEMEPVTLGPGGILEGARSGSVYIDHTTNSPLLARRVHGVFAEKGVSMLDAPVSGGVEGAMVRDLLVMVGGDAPTFQRCLPVLEAIGERVMHTGDIGSGCICKIMHNTAVSFAAELDLPSLGNQSRHKVDATPTRVRSLRITSTPANATPGYAEDETIRVRLDFAEAVSVTGTPYLVLDIAGVARRATYASGSGTRHLNFEYTVQAGDFDSDGISLCSDTFLDRGCGRISLNGGSISAQSDSLAAELDLPTLGNQSGHKVDATPDFMPNPGVGPMPNPSTGVVPRNWSLKPAGVGRGESFRLLFVSSTTRNATSADINDYNNHVIAAAGAGHSAIQAFKDGFRVIASTEAVDATDNAGLTGTGVPIYWLGSINQVADDYADLLDSTWDNENATNELGNTKSATIVWTGSTDSGIESTSGPDSLALGGDGLLDRGFFEGGGAAHPNSEAPLFYYNRK